MVKFKDIFFIVCLMGLSINAVSAAELSNNDFWEVKVDDKTTVDNKNYYFTWLGCASCLMVEEGVDLSQFEKLPLIARPDWREAAKIQIALQMLPVEAEVESQFFEKVKDNSVDIKSIDAMMELLISLGVNQEILSEMLTSKGLFKKIAEAEEIAQRFKVRYVPTVVVKGKYATDAKHAGSVAKFSEIIKKLNVKN